MLKCINILKYIADVLENYPKYKNYNPLIVWPKVVTKPETDYRKIVKAINEAIEDIRKNIAVFQNEDIKAK